MTLVSLSVFVRAGIPALECTPSKSRTPRGWDIILVPVELPESLKFHLFHVTVEKGDVDRAWQPRGRWMIRRDFRRTRAMPRDGKHRHSPRSRVVSGHQIMRRRICSSRTPPPATKAQPAANSISEDR